MAEREPRVHRQTVGFTCVACQHTRGFFVDDDMNLWGAKPGEVVVACLKCNKTTTYREEVVDFDPEKS